MFDLNLDLGELDRKVIRFDAPIDEKAVAKNPKIAEYIRNAEARPAPAPGSREDSEEEQISEASSTSVYGELRTRRRWSRAEEYLRRRSSGVIRV